MAAGGKNKVIRILSSNERSLFNAINSEDYTAAKQMIEGENVDVDVQDSLGRSPLIHACMLSDRDEQKAIITLLLKKEADVNLAEKHRRTALMTACREGPDSTHIIDMLLRNKADPNRQDENGDTALMHAVQTDNLEAVQTLVESDVKIDVELKNKEDDYALLLAAKQLNPDICEVLVHFGKAVYSDIPQFLRKHLPKECQEADYEEYSRDPFEDSRNNAQSIKANPYDADIDKVEEEARAMAEAEERAQEEAKRQEEARLKAEEEERAAAEAEMLREEEERKAKEEAETQAKAEEEAKALAEAEAKALAEAEAEAEAQALAEAEAEAKAKAEAEAEANAKADAEAEAKAEAERKAKANSTWASAQKKNVSDTRPTTARHNRPVKTKSDLKIFKTKSGRTIFPNAPHDRSYDKISEVREGVKPAPKKKEKPKKANLLADLADTALKKRTVYSTN